MRTSVLVFALTASGVLGGLAGALLAPEFGAPPEPARPADPSPAATPDRGDGPDRELAALRNRVEALEANLSATTEERARLREGLEAREAEIRSLRERLDEVAARPSFVKPDILVPNAGGFVSVDGGGGSPTPPDIRKVSERFRKAAELRALSEEDRWQKAREDLGLTPYQEEELKGALKERNEAMRAAVKGAEGESGDGGSIQIVLPDREKMREAAKNYNDRVSSALNAEQAKKWREDGYEHAMGGGGATTVVTTSFSTSER